MLCGVGFYSWTLVLFSYGIEKCEAVSELSHRLVLRA